MFEGRLKPGREQEFMARERELLTRTDVDGLLGVSIGRRLAAGAMQVMTLTVWRDQAAIEQFAALGIERPVFLTGADELVDSWRLNHYDAVDVPEVSDNGTTPA